ncbi:aquaporin [Aulographum hederae CBS 113979]|uniref:Aquaporin n=1 Tax=Aulographum hederae CBS 113979 TaxID=1176131 RepID=A0A6G1GMD4_9PEZI|nr:aquaporin [Aulographum hederae CBS 113979]
MAKEDVIILERQVSESVHGSSRDYHRESQRSTPSRPSFEKPTHIDHGFSGPDPNLVWSRTRSTFQDAFSEFWGTFIFLIFGFGVNAQSTLSDSAKRNWTSVAIGWGAGIMLGAYTASSSGGHLNPCVTLTLCVYRRFPWRKFPAYALAQTLAGFCAAAVIYGNYKSAIEVFEGGVGIRTVPGGILSVTADGTQTSTATAGMFATYPTPFISRTGAFFSEFLASAVLMLVILRLTDPKTGAGKLTPIALAFTFFGITVSLGWETSFAINFARDFGPRVFTSLVGYGGAVWSAGGWYFWIPIVAPFLGCLSGAWLHDMFLFDGESPINTPWVGLRRLVQRERKMEGRPETWV